MRADQDQPMLALKRARKADGKISRLFIATPEIFVAQQAFFAAGFFEQFTPQRAHPQISAADVVYSHIADLERRPDRHVVAAPVPCERKREAVGFDQRERTPSVAVERRQSIFYARREKSLLLLGSQFANQLRLPRQL